MQTIRRDIIEFQDVVIGTRVKLTYRGIAAYNKRKQLNHGPSPMDEDLLACEHEVIDIIDDEFHIKRVDKGTSGSGVGYWRITQDIFYGRGGYAHHQGTMEFYIEEIIYEPGGRLAYIDE